MADDNVLVDVVIETGVKERLEGSFKVLIEEADINPMITKVVESFFTNFMATTDEAALIAILAQMQDKFIPYILYGDE